MHWVVRVLAQYSNYEGRARRAEYWWYAFFSLAVSILLVLLDQRWGTWSSVMKMGLFSTLFTLLTLSPTLGATVRRLHDTGRSGWWIWWFPLPVVGPLMWLVLMTRKGQTGPNDYGPDPKAPGPSVGSGSGA